MTHFSRYDVIRNFLCIVQLKVSIIFNGMNFHQKSEMSRLFTCTRVIRRSSNLFKGVYEILICTCEIIETINTKHYILYLHSMEQV